MAGILYGVGVGPGDPELITLKAARIMKESDVIIVPGEEPKETVAYQIAAGAIDLSEKEVVGVSMPMTKDALVLEQSHQNASMVIMEYLKTGKQVAFLTLGDPTVYSTYIYVHKKIAKAGYETQIISGIPSFCAASALVNDSLVEKSEPLHVFPASYDIEDAVSLSGTKVFMKAGKKMSHVKKTLQGHEGSVVMIENCGMVNEKVYYGSENINENAGYYSLLIVKDK
jgi:precorrin-2/cobalt-factor-2 C20-methyltransferase